MTLVENDGTLPLSPDIGRIAVIGPIADSARDLLGDYAHLPHIETLAELRHRANPFGFPSSEVINPVDELSGMTTILGALRDRFGERVVHARGSGLRDGTDEELAEAVALAQGADVAIVAVGERSGLTDDATTGESRDRRDLGLLGRQQELLEAVVATGTPTVLVVVSGRPLAIEWAAEHCAAVLLAWVPGEAGPAAIADILAGDVDPGGRLPITIPRHVGQVPLTYRHHPTGGKSNWKIDYVDGTSSPLWPFGHGLSYTTFAIEHLRVDKSLLQTTGDTVAIQVEVTNTGTRTGDEVVQLYVRDEEATVARPVRELRGFQRVQLAAGECRTVTFRLSTEQLAYVDVDLRRVVEPGTVRLFVGRSAVDGSLAADIALVGPVVELVERRRLPNCVHRRVAHLRDPWPRMRYPSRDAAAEMRRRLDRMRLRSSSKTTCSPLSSSVGATSLRRSPPGSRVGSSACTSSPAPPPSTGTRRGRTSRPIPERISRAKRPFSRQRP